ncbi:Transmembrane protein 201-like [Homarus americanus]|uniref:Transmembrane protein 201-like n=1 Tax=Homarus americanus TaxID=6706 RepID=A0A8J5N1R1_HOMAM|nr:Transmembrane protein 201-like [Homarus americanus]
MEFDMVLPAIAGASGVFAGSAVLYSKLRQRFPVKANCWFCNKDTKDGDYNRDIPAQYCESLNLPLTKHKEKKQKNLPTLALGNGLCQTCNLNQTLKVRALADYTPIHPDNYDKEIEEYRKRLERTYALCRQCEATLHQTLGKQDSWLKPKLISWRLHLTSENKAKFFTNAVSEYQRIPFYLHLLHMTGLLVSVALFLCNMHHLQQDSGIHLVSLNFGVELELYLATIYKFSSPMIVTGLSMLLMNIFSSGKETLLVSDAVASFIWVGLLALCSSKQLLPAKDYNSLQVLISGACVFFTLWTSLVPRNFKNTRMNMKARLNKSMVSETSSGNIDDSRCTLNGSVCDDINSLTPPFSPHRNESTISPVRLSANENHTVADTLDTTLSGLKISTPLKSNSMNRPNTPFSPKLLFSGKPGYNPKHNDTYCSQRSIGSPPRISTKNITQSSWVAGGYWGHPVSPSREFSQHVVPHLGPAQPGQPSMYPLSRSSSQSSGFVSQSSGLPPYTAAHGPCSLPTSCHGSHYGELDRGSVLSEPAYKAWGYSPSLYPSDSASQYNYSRCQGRAKSDAQSLYSCASVLSDCSLQRTPPSPTASSSYLYQTPHGNLSENSSNTNSSRNTTKVQTADTTVMEFKNNNPKQYMALYRNPWIAFFLGMSIAANGFLVAIIYLHADIKSFLTS